jgi:polyhydroxyalkanoate synthesis regulator phasin
MVDGGKLTSAEKTEVLEHLTHNIASCTEEIEKCKAAGENAKKIEKLNEKKAAIVERKNAVNAVAPITLVSNIAMKFRSWRCKCWPYMHWKRKGARAA